MIKKLYETNNLQRKDLIQLIKENRETLDPELIKAAYGTREKHYGRRVFFRGLIEISNYCRNDCYYCGIRKNNKNVRRYRLSKEEILASCQQGYDLGFSTFVLQGGEDGYYNDERMVDIISSIKSIYPDCAITLSLGEKSNETYKKYYEAGADRYLLRHESATDGHYAKLHPSDMKFKRRRKCLYDLKDIGFQVGAGFMVGSPYQTIENMVDDLLFLKELDPHMVGIGPFIPHRDTVFAGERPGTVHMTLLMIGLTRLLLPRALLPATTALASIDPRGRERALEIGANVIMPNLSPMGHRKDYSLYDNKLSTDSEAAESMEYICKFIKEIGFAGDFSRGDYVGWIK